MKIYGSARIIASKNPPSIDLLSKNLQNGRLQSTLSKSTTIIIAEYECKSGYVIPQSTTSLIVTPKANSAIIGFGSSGVGGNFTVGAHPINLNWYVILQIFEAILVTELSFTVGLEAKIIGDAVPFDSVIASLLD